jgi:pectinesterase
MNYSANQVTIQAGVPASLAGSDDASGTLRIHKNDFKMYNVNVKNTFGKGSQAIALSQWGSRVGLYACGFYGYQDTLYASKGTQVYLRNYIEVRAILPVGFAPFNLMLCSVQGAVDFIFGRAGLAFFGGNTIGVTDAGCVTASGRVSDDTGSCKFNGVQDCWLPST